MLKIFNRGWLKPNVEKNFQCVDLFGRLSMCLSVYISVCVLKYLVVCPCFYIFWSQSLCFFLLCFLFMFLHILYSSLCFNHFFIHSLFFIDCLCLPLFFWLSMLQYGDFFLFVFVFQHLLLPLFLFYLVKFSFRVFSYFVVTISLRFKLLFSILLRQFLILSAYVFVN